MNKIEMLGLRSKAKLGDKEALFEFGQCYYFGIGVSSDFNHQGHEGWRIASAMRG